MSPHTMWLPGGYTLEELQSSFVIYHRPVGPQLISSLVADPKDPPLYVSTIASSNPDLVESQPTATFTYTVT